MRQLYVQGVAGATRPDGTFSIFHDFSGWFAGTDIVAGTGVDETLWFNGGTRIGRATTDGEVTTHTNPAFASPSGLTDLTPGPDGAIWFTTLNDLVGRISTGGAVTTYPDSTISQPTSIVAGSDGALWFTNTGNNSIGRVTPASQGASQVIDAR